MFDSHYPITHQHHQVNQENPSITTYYRYFECGLGNRYMILVDKYPEGFFVIQFCLRKYRKEPDRYLKTANADFANVKVISTCFYVLRMFLNEYPNASFAFQGIYDTKEEQKEICRNHIKSQRFRIYEYMVVSRISENIFNHSVYDKENAYLLINKRDKREDVVQIMEERFISLLR
ncbi:hypothetical protein [Flectobacillus longus]|uniref:hypothetical protein n=1 Tax=Flectobacillus longus TaxID=2984207 RepID=UPI0024B7BBA0|nr:hypothetical protein [Flectobacillus longus]MDI9880874.1 hypothetical protein [Flectobacillus longus]